MRLRRRTFLGLLVATLAARDVWADEPAATPPPPPPTEPPPVDTATDDTSEAASIDASWAVGGPDACARSFAPLPDAVVGLPARPQRLREDAPLLNNGW